MDERDKEEERKDRKAGGWGIERKIVFLRTFTFIFRKL
jgi:hypothetical protein